MANLHVGPTPVRNGGLCYQYVTEKTWLQVFGGSQLPLLVSPPNPDALAEWSGPVGGFVAQRNVHK